MEKVKIIMKHRWFEFPVLLAHSPTFLFTSAIGLWIAFGHFKGYKQAVRTEKIQEEINPLRAGVLST